MRITPLAVWAHKLNDNNDLYNAVRYQTMFTHSNEIAIMACYLYCFAIRELIKGEDPKNVCLLTLNEAFGRGESGEFLGSTLKNIFFEDKDKVL